MKSAIAKIGAEIGEAFEEMADTFAGYEKTVIRDGSEGFGRLGQGEMVYQYSE